MPTSQSSVAWSWDVRIQLVIREYFGEWNEVNLYEVEGRGSWSGRIWWRIEEISLVSPEGTGETALSKSNRRRWGTSFHPSRKALFRVHSESAFYVYRQRNFLFQVHSHFRGCLFTSYFNFVYVKYQFCYGLICWSGKFESNFEAFRLGNRLRPKSICNKEAKQPGFWHTYKR